MLKVCFPEKKAINGGYDGYSSTTCYGSSTVCHTEGNIEYTCSGPAQPTSEADCCCGHDAGNDKCIMG